MPISRDCAPVIETARLTLRAHVPEDLADSAAMWADPVVTRHIGGHRATEEETWSRLLRYAGLWSLLGYGYWIVRETATDAFVGEVGFADFRRALTPPLDGTPEVGWALCARAHGRGFATEAVAAALAWGDDRLPRPARTACIITPENGASIRVADKCGYRPVARTTYKEREIVIYER